MAQDPARELADLTLVHGFNAQVVQGALGHPVPVPAGLSGGASSPDRLAVQLNILRRWLNVLDLAITPAMLRQSLPIYSTTKSCEAILRYLVGKPQRTDSDRDKTDLVATFVFRAHAGKASRSSGELEDAPNAQELFRILELPADLPLSPTHMQMTREFPFLRDEVQDFRDFNELIDSGIIDRVRDLKQSFGEGFYHPRVLAAVAEYNDMLGERFSELFHDAARQIKEFAGRVQTEGGSIMAPLGDGVTVKHLVEMEVGNLLQQDYTHAREKFRRVTKYKKVVASRGASTRPQSPGPKTATAMPPLPLGVQMPPRAQATAQALPTAAVPTVLIQNTIEDSKLKNMEESIRDFVRAGGDKPPSMMPLKNASVAISPPEADAFRADFGTEQSFRADYAAVIRRMVAVHGRISSELADFKAKEGSVYLWKPHADSLAFLVRTAQQALDSAGKVVTAAEQRGLSEKVTILNLTVQRLRWEVGRTLKLLEAVQIAPASRP